MASDTPSPHPKDIAAPAVACRWCRVLYYIGDTIASGADAGDRRTWTPGNTRCDRGHLIESLDALHHCTPYAHVLRSGHHA